MNLAKSLLVVAMSLLVVACGEKSTSQPQFNSIDITHANWGREFQLTDHNGKQRGLADFRGKAVAVFFGYVNCPDVCPTTLTKLAGVLNALGKDAQRVQVLLVTLDPKRDTPDILQKYVPAFHPSFLGLYGDEQATEQIAKEFKVFYQRQKPGASGFYTVDHGGGIFVFDPQGRIRLFIGDEHSTDVITRDIKSLLAQSDGKIGR